MSLFQHRLPFTGALLALLFAELLLLITGVHSAYENYEQLRNADLKESKTYHGDLVYQNSAIRNRRYLWIDKVVPYELNAGMSASYNRSIHAAIAEYHAKTCIKFVKRTTERNWVKFVPSNQCYTGIGKPFSAGRQSIYLSRRCNTKGGVIHELMHVLGFYHEMSRPDRDQYIEILWENIEPDSLRNFRKQTHSSADTLGTVYDYDSLLHYHNWAFSKNGKVTVRSRQDPKRIIGMAETFSKLDLIKINALYDCSGVLGNWSSWSSFSPCDKKCEKYRQRFCYSKNRSKDCPLADKHGIDTEVAKCPRKECYAPVNGQWSKWSEWSACSRSCGHGNRTRTRICNDPAPKHGGKGCSGNSLERGKCVGQSRGPVYYRFMLFSIKTKKCLSHWGNKITIEFCNKNAATQKWAWSAYDQLVSVSTGLCLDLNDKVAGDTLILSRCCKEKPSQQWSCNGKMIKPNKTDMYINYAKKSDVVQLRSGSRRSSQWKIFGKKDRSVCSKKPDCQVKTERDGCCQFPFTYRGKEYKSCVASNTSGRKWCATSRNYSSDWKWGYCPMEACKVKTKKGRCCVFPFKYGKKTIYSCTKINFGNTLWCSLTSDYDKDRKWGRC